jgi:hypothetical protein
MLDKLNQYFTLKPSLFGIPSMYLDAKLKLTQMSNGVWAWGMSPPKYIKEAVSNCEKHLKSNSDGCITIERRSTGSSRRPFQQMPRHLSERR